jgi:hypothetical protein
VLPE